MKLLLQQELLHVSNRSKGNCMAFTSTLLRPQVCNRLRKCTAVLGGAGPPDSQGDPNVQEGLVQMVRLQIGKEKVKDSVEEEKLKLQQLAEEAKAEVDRLQQLTADRSTLAFGSALADINKSADEYEEVLRASRARAEAYSRELADWEVQTARARNEGTFFKGLFKADVLQQQPEGSAGNASSQPSTSQAQVDSKETMSEDKYTDKNAALRASSDVLKYSFSFLAFVLFGTVIGDLAGGSVSLGMDGCNFLLGLLLIYGAWKASQYS